MNIFITNRETVPICRTTNFAFLKSHCVASQTGVNTALSLHRCNVLCAWIIQYCSLSAPVVCCMVKSQWRGRLNAWGQALFSTPAAKCVSYVREGCACVHVGGGVYSAWKLLSLCHHVSVPSLLSMSYSLTNALISKERSRSFVQTVLLLWFVIFCHPASVLSFSSSPSVFLCLPSALYLHLYHPHPPRSAWSSSTDWHFDRTIMITILGCLRSSSF